MALLSYLVSSGCTTLRSDRTEFETPSAPAAGGIVPIGPRHSVLVEEVGGTWNGEPYQAAPETRARLIEVLNASRVFARVYRGNEPEPPPDGIGRVSIDASYESNPHNVANFFRALLVGTIGHRLDIEGRLGVHIRLAPDAEPIVHEVMTRATRVYFSSGRAGEAQTVLLKEVEAANRDLLRVELRSDPRLIAAPPSDPTR